MSRTSVADTPTLLPDAEWATLLPQIQNGLAVVVRQRVTIDEQLQQLQLQLDLLDAYTEQVASEITALEQRRNQVAAAEQQLRLAEQRLRRETRRRAVEADVQSQRPRIDQEPSPENTARVDRARWRLWTPVSRLATKLRRPKARSGAVVKLSTKRVIAALLLIALLSFLAGIATGRIDIAAGGGPVIENVSADPYQPGTGQQALIRQPATNAKLVHVERQTTGIDAGLNPYITTSGTDEANESALIAAGYRVRDTDQMLSSPSSGTSPGINQASPGSMPASTTGPATSPRDNPSTLASTAEATATPLAILIAPTPTPSTAPHVASPTPPVPTEPMEQSESALTPNPQPTSCPAADTLPAGSYCDESGSFTVWVYACETLTMTIAWGDGTVDTYEKLDVNDAVSHQYPQPGTYSVHVTSTFDPTRCQQSQLDLTYSFQYPSPG